MISFRNYAVCPVSERVVGLLYLSQVRVFFFFGPLFRY